MAKLYQYCRWYLVGSAILTIITVMYRSFMSFSDISHRHILPTRAPAPATPVASPVSEHDTLVCVPTQPNPPAAAVSSSKLCDLEAWATLFSASATPNWMSTQTYVVAALALRDSVRRYESCKPGREFLVIHDAKMHEIERWGVSTLETHGLTPLALNHIQAPYKSRRPELVVGWL